MNFFIVHAIYICICKSQDGDPELHPQLQVVSISV